MADIILKKKFLFKKKINLQVSVAALDVYRHNIYIRKSNLYNLTKLSMLSAII